MEKYALIVAGGKGKRMGHQTPKQFLPLAGKAILLHTLEQFSEAIAEIKFVLVLPKDQLSLWKEVSANTKYADVPTAIGGNERTDSVKNGLDLIPSDSLVGIHDAVRPLVSAATILGTFAKAEESGNAIPVKTLTDSLRTLEGDISKAVDRSNYVSVQTPQCFHAGLIKSAYENLEGSFTDDASVIEAAGEKINLVEGNLENIKITTPLDLKLAELLVEERSR
ncbi:MAG: 2-C-methyl-D-erythritol 4-phosphate cytidylyltransferase [Flavobacteriales bacterium]|nr:2-C-methyl-D-erythritol 4-phosphate cytidylyltransferase [Flavobacteriales bacterium]